MPAPPKPKTPTTHGFQAPGAPPAYGQTDLDYADYLKVPQLLQLQVPLSKPAHHDELLFITIHQAYELWFKLLLHEMTAAVAAMQKGDAPRARHALARCNKVLHLLVPQIHLLETMTPIDFLKFRDHLKPASGFQSLQFRELEFLAGLKDPGFLRYFQSRPDHVARLEERAKGPDLRTAFYDLVRKNGFKAAAADVQAELTDEAAAARLARLLLPIYEDPQQQAPLNAVAEALLEFDETFGLWREHHWRVVERIIGFKIGTGGSTGVAYLRQTTKKKFFPALWAIRTHLGEPA